MDFIPSLISAAISLLLFFMLYNKLSQISNKLSAQDVYYRKIAEDRQLAEQNEKYKKAFGRPKE